VKKREQVAIAANREARGSQFDPRQIRTTLGDRMHAMANPLTRLEVEARLPAERRLEIADFAPEIFSAAPRKTCSRRGRNCKALEFTCRYAPAYGHHKISKKGAMAMIDAERVFKQKLSSAPDRKRFGGPRSCFGFLVALLFCFTVMGRAQELTATLSGTVTDTTGAVVPGAQVTVTLNGTNGAAARVVQSDASGFYTAPNLQAGTYSVKVVAQGFETYNGKNIVLNVAEKHGFNVQLKAGSVTTTVTVEDNPVSVDTESSAQAGTISGQQVRELELSSRNFQQLVTLQPGVANSGLGDEAAASNTGLAINGARANANNWTVDGADINDSGSNATVVNTPSVDAIQEFTLARSNYDAGYGRSGGGQIVVATKSGTSAFHGDVYEFVRNTILDSNDYFNKMAQLQAGEPNKQPVNHHNVYGFTIGGPVFIPHAYNTDKKKTFFFWSEDWHKLTTPGSATMPAPTQAMLNGVVSGDFTNAPAGCTTYDAASNSTTISPSCYSKNSQVYLQNVFSKYQANSGPNYFFSYSAMNNLRDDIVRVDHYFNDKLHFYARYMNDVMPVNEPMGLWAGNNYPGLVNTLVDSPGKNVVGNLTWTISPKIINEVEFVWAQGEYHSTIASGQFATSSTVISALTPGTEVYPDPYGRVPAVSINGVTGFSAGSAPWKERNLDRTYFDNLSILLGKHTLRTGFQFQQMIKSENGTGGNPSYSFNSWGDFLVGNVLSFDQASRDVIPDLHYVNSEAYINDDWKLNQKLTINLGVRYSFLPSVTDVNNTLLAFDPTLFNAANAPTMLPDGTMSTSGAINAGNYANGLIFPKGTACSYAQANSLFASCSPYGAYVNPNDHWNFGPRVGFAYNPDGRGVTSIRGGFGVFYDRVLNGIWEQNAFANPIYAPATAIFNGSFDNIKGTAAAGPSYGPNGLTSTGTPTFKVPSYANYSLGVQRQLLPTTTIEVSYVGNQARHLVGQFDENQPTVSTWAAQAPGTSVNAYRPYLGYGGIADRAPLYTSNYNSLQISAQHSGHGLTLGIAYTWSKLLTTSSGDRANGQYALVTTDSYDLRKDYGPSTANTPQIFMANYIYDLPFFKGQHGLEGKVLGGWELSGITQAVSGQSFSVSQPWDPFDPNAVNAGIGLGASRPDQVSSVHMTKSLNQWFSTSSFARANDHFGSAASGSLLGPGMQEWDLAAIKNVDFADRYRFQLRGEFFNAFNHTNWNGAPAGGIDLSLADSSFGSILSDVNPRRIQLAAKFYF
jgi:Carboxypeptidase regulatory-like domain/TonB-dependent Receptor Plug Domain